MRKDFRYILKPKREIMMSQSQTSQFYRPRSPKFSGRKREIYSLRGSPKSNNSQLSNYVAKMNLMRSGSKGTIFHIPPNSGSKKKLHNQKYKDDYLTRTLKKSPVRDDAFCTIYDQDFERSYKYAPPGKSFFQGKANERPGTQSSQGSAREKRFRFQTFLSRSYF